MENFQRCKQAISIHAPSRERLPCYGVVVIYKHFNPRSLAGATTAIEIAILTAT